MAAIAVAVFHATDRAHIPFVSGQAGVDVFFVISGFIMWTVTSARPVRPGTFILQRMIRVVPLYWVVTLLMAAFVIVPRGALHTALMPASHIFQSLLFVPHTDPEGNPWPVLIPGWTLNYEVFFYALVALTLPIPGLRRAGALAGLLLALVAGGLLFDPHGAVLQTYTAPILLEFSAGIAIGVLLDAGRLPGRRWSGALFLAGLVTICIPFAPRETEEAWRVLFWGIPALFIVGGAVAWEVRGGCPDVPAGLFLGAASYSIYLVHGFVVNGAFVVLGDRSLPLTFAVAITVSVVAGALCFRFVERPATDRLRRLLRRSEGRPAWMMQRAPYVADPRRDAPPHGRAQNAEQ